MLRGLVAEVASGRGRSVLVEGEPGIGKSALVAAGVAEARRRSCRVFWCIGDASWQRLPLRVLADGLGLDIAELSVEESIVGLGGPADPVLVMVERLLDRVDRLCTASPVVLVLDDLHWVDEASLLVWHRLSRSVAQLPLLLVAAGRSLPRRAEVAALRRGLLAAGTATVSLGPLPEPDVVDLVGGLVAARVGPALRRFVAGAGGNPLYVRESVAALQRQEHLRVRAGVAELVDTSTTPVTLAAAIEGRLGILSGGAAGLLRTAALLGAEFSVVDLAAVTGRPATGLTAAVEEALAAGVLMESGPRLAFRHPLIHHALIDSTPVDQRAALYLRAARALAATGAPVERVAQQLLAAPGQGDAWMLDWLTTEVSTLTARAPQVAAELLERALAQLPAGDPRRERLATSLVTVLRLLARYDDVERVARPLLAHTTNPARAGRIAWTLAYALMASGRHQQGFEVTERTVQRWPSTSRWTARLRALQSLTLEGLDRAKEAAVAAEQAMAEAEQVGDRFALSLALHAQYLLTDDITRRAALLRRALAVVSDDPDSTDLRVIISSNLANTFVDLGQLTDAERALRETVALAERTATARLATARSTAASTHYRLGRWDDALTELEIAIELTTERPVSNFLPLLVHGLSALIAGYRDDWTTLHSHLAAVAGHDPTAASLRDKASSMLLATALAAEKSGQPAAAAATLRQVLTPEFASRRTDRFRCLPTLVRLAITIGDIALARDATQASIEDRERYATSMMIVAAGRCHGLLHADIPTLQTAADGYRTAGCPHDLAETLEDIAVLAGQRSDTQTARTAYAEAVEIYQRLDATWDLQRIQTRLRPYGIRGNPQRTRPTHGWYALTPTERRIAHLVADGLSNPDIATELFLSRRTVQTHVSHILAKLKAKSRREIAQEAAQHTTVGP